MSSQAFVVGQELSSPWRAYTQAKNCQTTAMIIAHHSALLNSWESTWIVLKPSQERNEVAMILNTIMTCAQPHMYMYKQRLYSLSSCKLFYLIHYTQLVFLDEEQLDGVDQLL